jgi:hypothetical protein
VKLEPSAKSKYNKFYLSHYIYLCLVREGNVSGVLGHLQR